MGHKDKLMAMLNMGGGLDFDSESNTKDVMWLGNCDEGCQLLADKLGWGVSQFYQLFNVLFHHQEKHTILSCFCVSMTLKYAEFPF